MLRKSIQNAVSWILLIYFAFIIVPPVSSFAALSGNAAASGQVNLQKHRSTALLLFDIMMWQQLKKVKHTEDFFTPRSTGSNTQLVREPGCILVVFLLLLSGLPLFSARYAVPLSKRFGSAFIYFSCSGIPPPVFL